MRLCWAGAWALIPISIRFGIPVRPGPQQLNFVGYKNPRADELIVRIRQEYNRDRQEQLTHELHRLIHEDQPYTFLYAPLSTRVLDKKIVLVEKGPDGKEQFKKIYPTKSGDITFYFHKWRKLEFTPKFSLDAVTTT